MSIKIKLFFLISMLFIVFSCKKKEIEPLMEFEHLEPEFIVVSDDDGKILFASNRKKMVKGILNGKTL